MADKNTASAQETRVEIFIPKGNANDEPNLFVGVNGKTWQIQRGVEVEVPDYVAEVLKNSMKQDNLAFELMSDLQKGGNW